MKRAFLWLFVWVLMLYGVAGMLDANAAKLRVSWVPPTQNTNGSPLTDLTGYRVEWGSCSVDGSFGTYQAGINVAVPAMSAWIYPTNLSPVCARIYAINSQNVFSAPAYASGPSPPKLSQPTH